MAILSNRIVDLLTKTSGLTDRDITDALLGREAHQQRINQECRWLESRNILIRQKREDGRIGNYLTNNHPVNPANPVNRVENNGLSEDAIKKVLETYLRSQGWTTKIAWGKTQGRDIEAERGLERWVIEVKGPGSRQPMRVNYFLSILGETLQRMNNEDTKYSIALPDMQQFRKLWERLPLIAKKRTSITALFVDITGDVTECV